MDVNIGDSRRIYLEWSGVTREAYRTKPLLPSSEAILVMYCLASVSALSSSSTKFTNKTDVSILGYV